MTKEGFLSMISNELENLEQEQNKLKKDYYYFKEVDPFGADCLDANIQLNRIKSKIDKIKDIVNLPAYLRIQAMSDKEIEEYKKNKIEELKLKIDEIESREKQKKMSLSKLQEKQNQNATEYASASDENKIKIVGRSQELFKEYDNIIIGRPSFEKRSLQEEIKKIEKSTSQQIKSQISSKISERYMYDILMSGFSIYDELLVTIIKDQKKYHQFIDLSNRYNDLMQKIGDEKNNVDFKTKLDLDFDTSCIHLHGLYTEEQVDKIIENFEKEIDSIKEKEVLIDEEFTKQKLSKFFDEKYKKGDMSEIDINFLQKHINKVLFSDLDYLQKLINERNQLSAKIFKTKDIKVQINSLDFDIKEVKKQMCEKIIDRYRLLYCHYISCNTLDYITKKDKFLSYNIDSIQKDVVNFKEKNNIKINEMQEARKILIESKTKLENTKNEYKDEISKIIKQIRDLGGEKFKDVIIPKKIDLDYYKIYQKEIIDNIQDEAQNQADIKEAEIRGITVEQLTNMRQQETIAPIINIDDTEEPYSL